MHAHHESLVGFHPAQILVTGCGECEDRGSTITKAIGALDVGRFQAAWTRAAHLGQHGLPNVSAAEAPLLNVLWAIQVQLERRGIPIGQVPTDSAMVAAYAGALDHAGGA